MLNDETLMASVSQVPDYVVDALDAVKGQVEKCSCCSSADRNPYITAYQHGTLTDPVFLGQLMMMLYQYDDRACAYLVHENSAEIDLEKLQYAIIALDLKLQGA